MLLWLKYTKNLWNMTLGDKKQLLSLGSETEMSLDGTGNSSDNGSMIR